MNYNLENLDSFIELIPDSVFIKNTDNIYTHCNESYLKYVGLKREAVIGKNEFEVHNEEDSKKYLDIDMKIFETKKNKSYREIKREKENDIYFHIDKKLIFDDDNNALGIFCILRDITIESELNVELKEAATRDHLTGLYNRFKIDEIIDYQIKHNKRYGSVFGIIMIDIDFFKFINDEYGHLVGDSVLQEFSNILTQTMRETDTIGRWGGEEFVIVVDKTDDKILENLAEKLRNCIAKYDFTTAKSQTASFGITLYKNAETIDELMARADKALYKAKNSGRNCVRFL